MRGVAFTEDRAVEFIQVDDPAPGPGDVVLEIKASGVCGSDLKLHRAPRDGGVDALGLKARSGPVIAGHEPCGVVAALGPGVDARRWKLDQAEEAYRVFDQGNSGKGVFAMA